MPTRSRSRNTKSKAAKSSMTIVVDGERYRLDGSNLTYEHEIELFRATKLTLDVIYKALAEGSFAPFMVAALVFLARRADGDAVTYAQIAESIDWAVDVSVHVGDDEDAGEEADPGPEDPAAD